MDTDERKKYAEEWKESALFFYNNYSYTWMCSQIKQYKTVLEIGCGTGQSTLSLVEHDHKVIAVEKNAYCLDEAKSLLKTHGYVCGTLTDVVENYDVIFVLSDIFEELLLERLYNVSFDVVVCWNVGTYWDLSMANYYSKLFIDYGLTIEQIKENPESSYAELIQWQSCHISRKFNVPIHLIDRNDIPISEKDDPYFTYLKKHFCYTKIEYNSKKIVVKSKGGRQLTNNKKVVNEQNIELVSISILLT